MRKATACFLSLGLLQLAAACDGEATALFPAKPECQGESITAFAGSQHQVISKLEVGAQGDGFDLDGNGTSDNKLSALGSPAKTAIDAALANYEIIIPLEFFDLQAVAKDSCVKFAVYLGDFAADADTDNARPYIEGGDCNDHDAAIRPKAAEVAGNFKDDNCNGLADEAGAIPSTDALDHDGDGETIAQGDCDDTNAMVKRSGIEVCGDGFDNDCDGVADRTGDATTTACSLYDPTARQDLPLDPGSFAPGTQTPSVVFHDGVITEANGTFVLDAGPSLFSVSIPVFAGVTLDLRITGATIQATVVEENGAIVLRNGRLGGVIDAKTADTIRGLTVSQLGILPEDSLLDATFAKSLGALLALPRAKGAVGAKHPECRTPDIDVDQDGLEAFCDADPDTDPSNVDTCIDGDGTTFKDIVDAEGVVTMHCSEALAGTKPRFVDGISVELNFETSPVKSLQPPR